MPFYEYQCKACGHALEAMQKINDAPLRKCPDCGKSQLTRLMSAPVFRLKGGGWYETDFKGDQDHKKNLADRPESDADKTDAKPAADAKADTTADAAKADKPADKPAEKPAEKSAKPDITKKPVSGGSSKRGASPKAPLKPVAKKAAAPLRKKAAAKAKSRR